MHDGFSGGPGKFFELGCGQGEFVRERNFVALDEWAVVEVEAARTRPVTGAGEFEVFESPANGETK